MFFIVGVNPSKIGRYINTEKLIPQTSQAVPLEKHVSKEERNREEYKLLFSAYYEVFLV